MNNLTEKQRKAIHDRIIVVLEPLRSDVALDVLGEMFAMVLIFSVDRLVANERAAVIARALKIMEKQVTRMLANRIAGASDG